MAFSKVDGGGRACCPRTSTAATSQRSVQGDEGASSPSIPITITARSITGNSEVRLRRELQTVAVPVFQFGVFSETDLTFYAGDDFDFGGRVHTNGNLFPVERVRSHADFHRLHHSGKEKSFRAHFSNGLSVATNYFTGNVMVPTAIGSAGRNLKYTGPNEASITTMPGREADREHELDVDLHGYLQEHHPKRIDGRQAARPAARVSGRDADRHDSTCAGTDENTTNSQVYAQRIVFAGEPAYSAVGSRG